MKVSVFGLGYVGSVTAACLADHRFHIVGVDVNHDKVNCINDGKSPVLESQLDKIIARTAKCGALTATTDVEHAVAQTDVSLVCVGTPSKTNGDLDLQYVCRVAKQIGDTLRDKAEYHTVVLRSTVPAGTTWDTVRPILEDRSGKRAGADFGLIFNPEFLREGTAVADFHEPPFTVLGIANAADAERVRDLYNWIDAELITVDVRVAETIKYVNNCYHALKVAFANEVGRLCQALKIDSHTVMDVFCKDTKQNLSRTYLKPGYAFGGSCLPKDLRAILYQAKSLDVPMQIFHAILESNRTQVEIGVRMVELAGNKRVGLLGLSFKAGTDDLRESPLVALAETLHGRGYTVRIFDNHVALSRLIGANKSYIEQQLLHLDAMVLDSAEDVIEHSDTVIIGNNNRAFGELLARIPPEKKVIDLVRITEELGSVTSNYQGVGW